MNINLFAFQIGYIRIINHKGKAMHQKNAIQTHPVLFFSPTSPNEDCIQMTHQIIIQKASFEFIIHSESLAVCLDTLQDFGL